MGNRRCILCKKVGSRGYFGFPQKIQEVFEKWHQVCEIPANTDIKRQFVCFRHFQMEDLVQFSSYYKPKSGKYLLTFGIFCYILKYPSPLNTKRTKQNTSSSIQQSNGSTMAWSRSTLAISTGSKLRFRSFSELFEFPVVSCSACFFVDSFEVTQHILLCPKTCLKFRARDIIMVVPMCCKQVIVDKRL